MDLRYRPRARTTQDVNVTVSLISASVVADLRERWQTAADIEPGDYVTFRKGVDFLAILSHRVQEPSFQNAPGQRTQHEKFNWCPRSSIHSNPLVLHRLTASKARGF